MGHSDGAMSCVQLSSWFRGKNKPTQTNNVQDYAYWMQLYNDAKARKMINNRLESRRGLAKFENIHSWLEELENEQKHGRCDYIDIKTLEKAATQGCLYSGKNDDYSFWSLDDTTRLEYPSDSQTEYCHQIRRQAMHLYAGL